MFTKVGTPASPPVESLTQAPLAETGKELEPIGENLTAPT